MRLWFPVELSALEQQDFASLKESSPRVEFFDDSVDDSETASNTSYERNTSNIVQRT
jgi:hypothetical protein